MAHDDTRSLARGAVVETRLCARVLGLKLLVIDGEVTLWPAEPARSAPVVASVREAPPGATVRAIGPVGTDDGAGARLEATAQRLDASAERLRRLRPRRG